MITDRARTFFDKNPSALPTVEITQQLMDLYDGLSDEQKQGVKLKEFLLGTKAPRERTGLKLITDKQQLLDGEFRGIAAATEVEFVSGFMPTIIKKGAFEETIVKDRDRIKILWQHDPDEPIGKPTLLRETDEGLEFIAELSDTQRANEALELMRDGVINEVSIGWSPVAFSYEENEDTEELTRIVNSLKLWEISPVSWGANPGAKIKEVNSDLGGFKVPDEYVPLLTQFIDQGGTLSYGDDGSVVHNPPVSESTSGTTPVFSSNVSYIIGTSDNTGGTFPFPSTTPANPLDYTITLPPGWPDTDTDYKFNWDWSKIDESDEDDIPLADLVEKLKEMAAKILEHEEPLDDATMDALEALADRIKANVEEEREINNDPVDLDAAEADLRDAELLLAEISE
jgi:HK97 family phage prohead protease